MTLRMADCQAAYQVLHFWGAGIRCFPRDQDGGRGGPAHLELRALRAASVRPDGGGSGQRLRRELAGVEAGQVGEGGAVLGF
jgi:hypothetical protein